jgi:ketosteroid isomerase-like protein
MVPRTSSRIPSLSRSALTAALLLFCFSSSLRAEQDKNHHHKQDVKKVVEALEQRWRTAQLAGDVTTLDHMLADDFIGISMSGEVHTKAQQLDRIRSKRLVLTRIDLDDMKVKLVDSVAIVTSQALVEGTSEGMPVKGTYRYTRIYRQLPTGEWKITSFEATRIRRSKSTTGRQSPSATAVQEPRFG